MLRNFYRNLFPWVPVKRHAGPPSLEDRRPVGRCEYIYMYVLFNVLFRLTRDPYIACFDQDTK